MPLTRSLPYADVELVLTTWLQGQFPATRVVTDTPSTTGAANSPSIIQVVRIGGPRRFTLDHATVDVEVFAADRITAATLANQVGMLLEQQLPGTKVSGGSIASVFCTAGPSWLPWDNTNVRRFGATYQVNVHAG